MGIGESYEREHATLEFEKKFIEVLETEEYDFFIDVGAAWGYHSVPAANHCKKVYAFEPSDPRLAMLEWNVENLELDNIVASNKAVGTGKLELYTGRGMLGPPTGIRNQIVKPSWIPLEIVAKPHLSRKERGIIKIDVEGNELDVIKSAGNLNLYKNVIWLIERHERNGLGYPEADLFNALEPFDGKLVGSRSWTWHYIFRWREG